MSKSRNPFLDDDEVDDEEFLKHPQQGSSGYMLGSPTGGQQNEWEEKRRQLLLERRKIEERTLQSTNNSLGLLHESEQVGILTAEELVKQREQLEGIDENLDFINSTMKTSQKHINSIKSVFSGVKNYFTRGGSTETPPKASVEPSAAKKPYGQLQDTVDNLRADTGFSIATHPAMRTRDLSYDEPDSDVSPVRSPTASLASSNVVEEKLDKNLEFMSLGLGRLKNLAIGLNDEIETQNELIDKIHTKADKADETLEYQNRQIKRLLKK